MQKNYLKKIKEVISKYNYGKQDFAEKKLIIQYNPKTKNVFIKDFFSYDINEQYGVCHELQARTYQKIKQEIKELELYRCLGFDRYFFCPKNEKERKILRHSFLLGIEKTMIKGINTENIEKFIKLNGTLIDPSYGFVEPYNTSEYQIIKYVQQNETFAYSKDLLLDNKKSTPLGTLNDSIVALAFSEEFPNKLVLGLTHIDDNEKRKSTWMDIRQEGIIEEINKYKKIKNNKLLDLMLKICDIRLYETNRNFEKEMINI